MSDWWDAEEPARVAAPRAKYGGAKPLASSALCNTAAAAAVLKPAVVPAPRAPIVADDPVERDEEDGASTAAVRTVAASSVRVKAGKRGKTDASVSALAPVAATTPPAERTVAVSATLEAIVLRPGPVFVDEAAAAKRRPRSKALVTSKLQRAAQTAKPAATAAAAPKAAAAAKTDVAPPAAPAAPLAGATAAPVTATGAAAAPPHASAAATAGAGCSDAAACDDIGSIDEDSMHAALASLSIARRRMTMAGALRQPGGRASSSIGVHHRNSATSGVERPSMVAAAAAIAAAAVEASAAADDHDALSRAASTAPPPAAAGAAAPLTAEVSPVHRSFEPVVRRKPARAQASSRRGGSASEHLLAVLSPLSALGEGLDSDDSDHDVGRDSSMAPHALSTSSNAPGGAPPADTVAAAMKRLTLEPPSPCTTAHTPLAGAAAEAACADSAAAAGDGGAAELLSRCLPFVFDFLHYSELQGPLRTVGRAWWQAAEAAASWRVAEELPALAKARRQAMENAERAAAAAAPKAGAGVKKQGRAGAAAAAPPSGALLPTVATTASGVLAYSTWQPFLRAFPWGCFLAQGGYKQVYRVWCAARARQEAVSVMDALALDDAGCLPVVQAELQCGWLASELVRTGVCPHYVTMHQVFTHTHAPHDAFPGHWGCEGDRAPQGRACPYNAASPKPTTAAPPSTCAGGAAAGGKKAATKARGGKAAGAASSASVAAMPGAEEAAHFAGFGAAPGSDGGLYQYIRMELCSGGDLEEHLRGVEDAVKALEAAALAEERAAAAPAAAASTVVDGGARRGRKAGGTLGALAAGAGTAVVAVPPASTAHRDALAASDADAARAALTYTLQMVVSLHCCHAKLGMRHNDVKLLNFLLLPAHEALATDEAAADTLVCQYTVDGGADGPLVLSSAVDARPAAAAAPLSLAPRHIVKLGDWGTADTRPEAIGIPINSRCFTTLENLPPEYYLCGSGAVQGYAADAWALGLSMLHLFTGCAPYEEVLAEVRCPVALREELTRIWSSPREPLYAVLREVATGGDEDYALMADTLYRFAVLLGPDRLQPLTAGDSSAVDIWGTPAGTAMLTMLTGASATSSATAVKTFSAASKRAAAAGSTAAGVVAVAKAYADHVSLYSISTGTHLIMMRARRRLAAAAGSFDLLMALLHAQPARRCNTATALAHPAVREATGVWVPDAPLARVAVRSYDCSA